MLTLLTTLLAAAPAAATAPAPAAGTAVQFTDITRQSGIRFRHYNGAFGKKYIPEAMGSGVCAIDFDGDGLQDLVLVNGAAWPGRTGGPATSVALYRNTGGAFVDVTAASGIKGRFQGMGCAVGDYDDDGRPDIYVTALGRNYLFHNLGNGRFEEVAERAGLADVGWSTSAAWLDYDRDGHLDLFVGHYVKWTPATDIRCTLDGASKSYCTPESYQGESGRLFRNRGDGTFEDVSAKAGIAGERGKTMGVGVFPDEEGWPDLVVTNDTQPNQLFVNRHDGTFVESGLAAGIAFDESGRARGAMGVDVVDTDGHGKMAIAIGNFSNEMISFYVQERKGFFFDSTGPAGIGPPSLLAVKFGLFFFDANLDGKPDLFVVNGHIEDDIQKIMPEVSHEQLPLLYLGREQGRFEEVSAEVAPLRTPFVGRGAAFLDLDGDGDLDLVATANGGPARVLRNDTVQANHKVRLTLLRGERAGDGIGAVVSLGNASGRQVRWVRSGSSYLSQSELPLTFGLGANAARVTADIEWPDRKHERLELDVDRAYTIRESKGVIASAPFASPRLAAR
ncbi:MAG TPA: CRTAC1 family protein [Myxococcales bacterium]